MPAATVTVKPGQTIYGHVHKHTWAALNNVISPAKGVAIAVPVSADRTVQFEGTWGAGTTTLEGSDDDDGSGSVGNYHTLHDPQGNLISVTAAALIQISENPMWIRPSVSGADGTTNVTVTLLSRGTL